jgi:tetratricopeptide (TPR) repeat protein
MKPLIAFIGFCLLCLILGTCLNAASIYRGIDKDGNIYFTDNPTDQNINFSSTRPGKEYTDVEKLHIESDRYRRSGQNDMRWKNYNDAVNNFSRAFEICKTLKAVKCQSVTLNDMGNAFKAMGNSSQADAMFKQAADVLVNP